MINLLILAILSMQIQNGCTAVELGLKNIGDWAGPLSNVGSPNEISWELTLYSCKAHPEMLAGYLILKRSYTVRSKVAARSIAIPGLKKGEWMEFLIPNSKEKFKARKLADNNLEIVQEASGQKHRFSLPPSRHSRDLVLYGENCGEWKRSLESGKWSQQLWQE